MRQLPATTSNSGATGTTENSRSRSHLTNDATSRAKVLSNGLIKEPIVTRSKSRLKGGRRATDRSPRKKSASPLKGTSDVHQRRKVEKEVGRGAASRNNSSSSSCPSSPRTEESMYARHYKSYRGLNGVKSRRAIVQDQINSNHTTNNNFKKVEKRRPVESTQTRKDSSRLAVRNNLKLKAIRNGTTRNHLHQNGIRRTSSPERGRSTRCPSSRIRQLVLRRKKQLSNRKLRGDVSPPKSSTSEDRSVSPQSRDKANKRRSALWVLNCEAESFLFGETAAEKHEVELPPLPPSPPPKKRRWRATELGELLEKTPIMESKLRKSSSSESGNSDMHRDFSPPRKRPKPESERTPRRGKAVKEISTNNLIKTPSMCSTSKSVKGNRNQDPQPRQERILSPKPELLSPIPFLYSPDSIDYEAKTVQFHQMLDSLDWYYTFEHPPKNEPWYNTFNRSESSIVSYKSFENPLQQRIVLPYEMDKPLRRSRTKPARNSRKSPRCHASTLAILSSERPVRSTRSSVTSDTSPTASVNNIPSESTLQRLLLSPTPSTSAAAAAATTPTPSTSTSTVPQQPTSSPQPSTSRRFSPTKVHSRRRNISSTSPKPNQIQINDPKENTELGAAEYLWDSIQFLSDNYVVGLLSGDDLSNLPEVTSTLPSSSSSSSSSLPSSLLSADLSNHKNKFAKNHRCTNNNYVNCPVKHFVKHNMERSERKASLRSGDNPTVVNNVNNSKLVSTPKSSPRNQSHHHGTNNHVGGHHHHHNNLVSSPPASPTTASVNDRVPPVNGVSRRFTSSRSPPPTGKCNSVPAQNNFNSSKLTNNSCKNSKGSSSGVSNGKVGKRSQIVSTGDNGLISHDKIIAPKKSPVVLVTDLFSGSSKVKPNNNNNNHSNNNNNTWEEESLFIGDGLPPLPQWPA